MLTLYGISNCDTVKKAQRYLNQENQQFEFHDFRKQGIDAELVQFFLEHSDADTLINKRSTTWKQLDEASREKILAGDIIELCVEHPTLIKRPVLRYNSPTNNKLIVGFSEKNYQAWLAELA